MQDSLAPVPSGANVMDQESALNAQERTISIEVHEFNQATASVGENCTGYDDFSSLRLRLPEIATQEEVTTMNPEYESDQVQAIGKRETSLAGYDDFSSLRSRLTAQINGSVSDFINASAMANEDTAHEMVITENTDDTEQVDLCTSEREVYL